MNHQQNTQHNFSMEDRYRKAGIFMQGYGSNCVTQNDVVFSTWIDNDHFWYERATKAAKNSSTIGRQFRLVNAKTASNMIAFDHAAFATALAKVTNQNVDADSLPISHVNINLYPLIVSFTAFGQRWQFNSEDKCCLKLGSPVAPTESLSSDGKKLAFARNNNLWLRDTDSGKEYALTRDGQEDYFYGTGYTAWGAPGIPGTPGLWSSDSQYLLTVVRDKREVKSLPCVDHVPVDGTIRPTLQQVKVAYPGDEHLETFQILCIDVSTGQSCVAKYPPCIANYNEYCGFFGVVTWWASDNKHVYFIDAERGDQVFRLMKMDIDTGATRELFKETSSTYINLAGGSIGTPLHRYLANSNELIWWSERNGWGHLYLYDLTSGELKKMITSGEWRVRDVVAVDEHRRELIIQTSGRISRRDPYYRDVCRVQIDTGKITTLLSCDAEILMYHQQSFAIKGEILAGRANKKTDAISPNKDYMIVTQSRVDQGSDTSLVDREGSEILKLESTNLSLLPVNWQWPEPIQVLAADGQTTLYGTLFRPSGFSPDKQYPIINFLTAGPWLCTVPKVSFNSGKVHGDRHYFYCAALAELGFIVLVLDTRGTALRSKAFQDESYGWVPSSGNTDDYVSALEQLTERYPYMDKNRIGIFSQGYRSGLQNFMERQDIYKVCVCMMLLDDRLTGALVGERHEGIKGPIPDKQYPEDLANNLQGKLMLMNSMSSFLSAGYPPASTFRVIDALQKANKDFDMLIVPHGGFGCDNYMFRRGFDYLVQHLLGVEPPKEYLFSNVNM